MKPKVILITLAATSLLLVLADTISHLSAGWRAKKLLTILTPQDDSYARMQEVASEDFDSATTGLVIIAAQAAVIFLVSRIRIVSVPNRRTEQRPLPH